MNKRFSINKIISVLLISCIIMSSNSIVYSAQSTSSTKTGSSAASNITKIDLTPKFDKNEGLYGYVDAKGKWVIKPKFSYAHKFSEGLAAVADDKQNCQWGYILPDGTYAITPKFLAAYDFKNGFAVVNNKMLAATINKKGNYISQTQYYLKGADTNDRYRAAITNVNTVMVQNAKYGLITNEGKIIKPEYDGEPYLDGDFLCVYKEDVTKEPFKRKLSIVLSNSKVLSVEGRIISTSEGVALLKHDAIVDKNVVKKQDTYSYVTLEGKIIKSFKDESGKEYPFLDAKDFSEGVACVKINKHKTGDNQYYDQWGFVKKDGSFLISPCYMCVDSFKNGVAAVKENFRSWGYVKKDLSWFIEPVRDDVEGKEYNYCVSESKTILKGLVNDDMSDYEKVEKIYSYITSTVEYYGTNLTEIPRVAYSAYGALKHHRAVCQGYAELAKIMLDLEGIECIYISGDASDTPHGWNLVKLNGNYYHIDATWDAGGNGKGTKNYFLKSDDYMKKSREWNYSAFPAAPKNYK